MLRHTAEQAELHCGAGMLEPGEIAQTPQYPLFGVLANRTRIQQDYVGQLGPRRRRITCALEHRAHELRVCDIHLAAVRFDIYARLRRMVCGFGHGNELNLRLWAVRDTTSIGETARFEGPSHIGWHMVLQNSMEGCGRGGGGFKMLLQLKI